MTTQITNQNNLKTIKELFSADHFYRVPDYQRGYSWNKEFIELWNDIIRLFHINNISRKHYVGMLALDEIKQEIDLMQECLQETTSFYIVDGQQRITSIIIILKTIFEYAKEENIKSFDYNTVKNILENTSKIHRFGYSVKRQDKAEEYFSRRIYDYRTDMEHSSQYLSNINFAAEYIAKELDQFDDDNIVEIVNIILNRLIFNVYYITEDFDVRVTFETMNNRGKPLTNLELLKNRLMYLSTFFNKNDNNNYENRLQNKIDIAWKNIYDYLNYENSNLSDDLYLKAHWIVYKRLSKKNGNAFIDDILNNEFSVDNGEFYQACCRELDYNKAFELLYNYIESLELYSKFWAIVNIPDNIDLKIPNEEKIWLKRLSRLPDLFYAKVSTMVVLAEKNICSEDKIEFYNILEKFIFIFKLMAQDKNDMSFLIAATRNLLWCDKNEKNKKIKALINSIKQHDILPLNKNCIMQAIERFHEYIMNKNYYNWNGLKYFLFEYNNSLQIQNAAIVEWYKNKEISIEHILPQDPKREYWQCMLEKYNLLGADSEEQRLNTINSLGNLLLLSTGSENSSLKNYSFPVKKDISVESGKFAYCYGSRSAIKISKEEVWTLKQIYERSTELFNFMYENWLKLYINKEEWDAKVNDLNLYNFEYNKLDNTAYEDLKNKLKGIDTSLERNEAEQKLKSLPEDNLYVKKLESFFDKDVFHMKKNPSNISYLNSKYTYVIEKDYENNLKFFKCGTEINGKAYRIQYNFIDNKLWINTWNDDGEYYFENSDNFPDKLKRFIKSFFRYIRKTTENDIPKFYT